MTDPLPLAPFPDPELLELMEHMAACDANSMRAQRAREAARARAEGTAIDVDAEAREAKADALRAKTEVRKAEAEARRAEAKARKAEAEAREAKRGARKAQAEARDARVRAFQARVRSIDANALVAKRDAAAAMLEDDVTPETVEAIVKLPLADLGL